jgi:N-sulfoglucosamine sulfohydrolase
MSLCEPSPVPPLAAGVDFLNEPVAVFGVLLMLGALLSGRLDRGVGELLDRLDKSGLTDRTLVIYLGDHGAQMPRGKKTSYEGGLRIPLLMRWPGHIDRGTVRSQLISTVDLMPTILDACGVDAPSGLAGRSLLPLLQDANQPWRRYLFTEFTLHWPLTYYPSRTVRDERYKLIANLLPDRKNPVARLYRDENKQGPTWSESMSDDEFPAACRAAYSRFLRPPAIELYDLANDPHEWVNLADDPMLSDVRSRLEDQLTAWQERTGDTLRHPQKLGQFTREVDATIVDGEYRHVGPDHPWKYLQYLNSEQP